MLTTPKALNVLLDEIHQNHPIKVWSFIVTIFGDLAPDPAQEISAAQLQRLTIPIGIKPEALRVALHRLRKDDWITLRKEGRTAHYSLSKQGQETTRDASLRVFADVSPPPINWQITLLAPNHEKSFEHLKNSPAQMAISPTSFLGHPVELMEEDPLTLPIKHDKIPDWMRDLALPAHSQAEHATLLKLFEKISKIKNEPDTIEPMCLRLLAVHEWRRVALKHSNLALELQKDTWIGHEARRHFHELLNALPRKSLTDLADK